MFEIGDYAVCPGHGVAQICDIEVRELGRDKKNFYVLKVITNGMTVMVPTDSEHGIRGLVTSEEINKVYDLLVDHNIKIDNSTWNRRYREYRSKIQTGSLKEIAEVFRALYLLKNTKNLSFGEKKMLDECKTLLVQEIAISGGQNREQIANQIESCFGV